MTLLGLGAVTLAFGGSDAATYGWAMVFLIAAATQVSLARWFLRILASRPARTWPA